ncbi:hypothetical protein DHEL01_v200784 [Diaporthe helianthi]|uniref:Uncharacterized protein n=1 Tax=Diaporthe helianthi TaxID=158607 RepID=A0A2P5IEA0_DIAHE|nr:hypothetical protein DHEL01_v200784 [Diaporthe helianthi]
MTTAPPKHGTAAWIEWLRGQEDKSHFKLWFGGVGFAATPNEGTAVAEANRPHAVTKSLCNRRSAVAQLRSSSALISDRAGRSIARLQFTVH